MKKIIKKVTCVTLSLAMIFTSGTFGNLKFNIDLGFMKNVSAAQSIANISDSTEVDNSIVPDTELLNALKDIIGSGSSFTFKEMKAFEGEIDLTGYTGIQDITGLGYARSATVIDMSTLNNIKEIPSYEFYYCSITEVRLPETVESIGTGAFQYCESLTTINIPDSVTKIYDSAFQACSSLDNVTLPEGLIKLGSSAFASCSSLSSIVVPDLLKDTSETVGDDSVNGIGANVFSGCSSLKSIVFGTAMTSVPVGFLANTESLRKVDIPDNFTAIKTNAFNGSGIYTMDLSACSSLTTIGANAFQSCSSLSEVDLPASVTSINDYVFDGCSSLRTVNIEEGSAISSVGKYSFAKNYSLADVTFLGELDKLTSIGDYAFYQSSYKTTTKDIYEDNIYIGGPVNVVIPGNVTSVGTYAFAECRNLDTVEFKSFDTTPTKDTVKSIGAYAFYYDWHMTSLVLPEQDNDSLNVSLTIGDYAFRYCTWLENVNFPSCLTSIGKYGFADCGTSKKYARYATLYYIDDDYIYNEPTDGATEVTMYAKEYNVYDKLTQYAELETAYVNLDMATTTKTTGLYVIYVVDDSLNSSTGKKVYDQVIFGLKDVDLSDNVRLETIGNYAFANCANLNSFKFPDNATQIPTGVLSGSYALPISGSGSTDVYNKYYGLESVDLGSSVETIGDSAFTKCYNLSVGKYFLPSTVKTIGSNAFSYCSDLGTLVFPSSLETIGESAFQYAAMFTSNKISQNIINNTGLYSIDLSEATNIKSIGKNAFAYTAIKRFVVDTNAPLDYIKAGTFTACVYLTDVSLSDSVESIASGALAGCSSLSTLNVYATTVIDRNVVYSSSLTATNNFNMTVRNTSDITVRNNETTELELYPIVNTSTYDSYFESVKVGDITYNWDAENTALEPDGDITDIPIKPSVSTESKKITAGTYSVDTIQLTGLKEATDVSLNVQMLLNFPTTSTTTTITVTPNVEYVVDVSNVPCVSIDCDTNYYLSYKANTANKGITIAPTFNPEETTDEITWELADTSKVVMEVSEDGRSAVFYASQKGYGSTRVKITAGKIVKYIYVYVSAPTNSIAVSPTTIDIPYSGTGTLTATIKYDSEYADYFASYGDKVTFTSSDESVVAIGDTTTVIGESVSKGNTVSCELIAGDIGTATITAKCEASGKTATCKVTVLPADVSIYLVPTSDTSTEIKDGDTISIYRTNTSTHSAVANVSSITYNYHFTSDEASSYEVEYAFGDATIAKVSNYTASKQTITVQALKSGKTTLTIYPKGQDPAVNGITLNVVVKADVSGINMHKTRTAVTGTTVACLDTITNVIGGTNGTYTIGKSTGGFDTITCNDITFTSSDESIATVDEYGYVTALTYGTVVITCTATAEDGTVVKSATSTVTCKKAVGELKVNKIANQIYTGNDIKPNVKVYDGSKLLTLNVDYSIKYANVKNPGVATVTITGVGDYDGVVTATFNIYPAKVKNVSQSGGTAKTITFSWTKNKEATGYVVYKVSGGKYVKVGKTTNLVYTVKKLSAGKTYTLAVRAYTTVNGKTYYGAYSTLKATTAPAKAKIASLKAAKKKITVKWKKVSGATGYEVYMSTSKSGTYSLVGTVKKGTKVSYVKKGLTSKTTYYFKVRAYRTVKGVKVYGAYSAVKSKKAK